MKNSQVQLNTQLMSQKVNQQNSLSQAAADEDFMDKAIIRAAEAPETDEEWDGTI